MNNNQRKVFWDTLCTFKGKNTQEESLNLMKKINYPKYLCRYRTMNSRNLEALQSNKMYFISADKYDDPFDTYITYDLKKIDWLINNVDSDLIELINKNNNIFKQYSIKYGMNAEELKNIKNIPKEEIINNVDYDLRNRIKDIIQKQQYSICFSEDCFNETLWLKYADNHKGFCLLYDLENEKNYTGEIEYFERCPSDIKTPIYPIYYSDEKYDATNYALSIGIFYYLMKHNEATKVAEFMTRILPTNWEIEKICLIKHKYHEYDKEWRMILPANPEKPIYKKWIPDGIIIGLKTSLEDEKLLIRAAQFAGIVNIYKSYIDEDFNLNTFKYSNEEIEKIINND